MSETNKSVLVIDTPLNCSECMFRELSHCIVTGEMIDSSAKPDWCPLSPLPQYRPINEDIKRGDTKSMTHLITSIHDIGYNECLDEILKGNE